MFFRGPQNGQKSQKIGSGAVSGKFSGDLKVAHGDSATDEPKKSGLGPSRGRFSQIFRRPKSCMKPVGA